MANDVNNLQDNNTNKDFFVDFINNLDNRFKLIFLSSIIWGILAHGMGIFNKYSIHDDIVSLFSIGTTYRSGRWFLHILGKITTFYFDSPHYSLPLTHGLFTFVCIALAAYLIVRMLDIRKTVLCIAISGVMITSPSIAVLFAYMFTAPYYAIAILLAVVGAYVITQKQNMITFIIGTVCIACSLGTYQAYYSLTLGLLVLYGIKYVNQTFPSWKQFFKKAIFLLAACAVAMALYFICAELMLKYYNSTYTDYKGISSAGREGIRVYLSRALYTYHLFINPYRVSCLMFPMRLMSLYYVALLSMVLVVIKDLYDKIVSRKYVHTIQEIMLVVAYPLAENFIFVMCAPGDVNGLMKYSHVLILIAAIYCINQHCSNTTKLTAKVYVVSLIILLLGLFQYVRYDNAYYLKLDFANQRTISYAISLITQIKSLDGYNENYPIVAIGRNVQDKTLEDRSVFNKIAQYPIISVNGGISRYAIFHAMEYWCGYKPKFVDQTKFVYMPEVAAMPMYPNDGSIKIIDKTIVIKFKE